MWRTLAMTKGQLTWLKVRRHFATRCVHTLCKCTFLRAYWILLALEWPSIMFYELLKQRLPLTRLRAHYSGSTVLWTYTNFPPNCRWLSSCHRKTVWHTKVSQLCFCLSLMRWTMWYVGSVFVNWNYLCRVGDLDSVGWELLQPRGGAESLNMLSLEYFPLGNVWMLLVNRCSAGVLFPMLHQRINTHVLLLRYFDASAFVL